MKKLLSLTALLLALILLCGCSLLEKLPFSLPFGIGTTEAPEEPVCGGVTDNSDPNASKRIDSTEITKFHCYFSTTTAVEPGTLGRGQFWLTAEKEADTVTGTVHIERAESFAREFTADASFLDELQGVGYELYDMAQYNGRDYFVAGLPEDFGATLEVDYASGETIRAYDNQSNFLSEGFMRAVTDLFMGACAEEPSVITLEAERTFLDADNGFASYPVFYVLSGQYEALTAALDEISATEQALAEEAVDRFSGGEEGWLYYDTNVTVTRCDSEYVSFFVKEQSFEDAEWDAPWTAYRGYTVETATGKLLSFDDILRDRELFPIAVEQALTAQYPDLELYDRVSDNLREAAESDSDDLSVALSYGQLLAFVGEDVATPELGSRQVTLSFVDYPQLVGALFMTEPENYIVPLTVSQPYKLGDSGHTLRMDWQMDEDAYEGEWTLLYGENSVSETYFGYAPDCNLVKCGEESYLYVRVPTGDVAMFTDVFALTDSGAKKLGQVELALAPDGCNDPEQMKMYLNEFICSNAIMLNLAGFYRVGADGLPEQTGNLFTLSGGRVKLKNSGRYNPADRAEAAVSGGMWNLAAGQILSPLQTDRESFLDFITDDGRVVRFSIDEFSDKMQLDNFGTLDDVFEPYYE